MDKRELLKRILLGDKKALEIAKMERRKDIESAIGYVYSHMDKEPPPERPTKISIHKTDGSSKEWIGTVREFNLLSVRVNGTHLLIIGMIGNDENPDTKLKLK